MKTSFSIVARAMVLAACVLGVAARIPKPMVVDDLRKAVTPKQTAIDDLMNAGTPKKTAIDEDFQVKAAKTHAGPPKKTAIDEDMNAGTPKKNAIDEDMTPKKTAIDEDSTPKKTANDEDFEVKAAKTQAYTPKKTANDEDFEIKAAKTEAHTPKKTAIDEERRRSYGSLHGKTAPTRLVHVPIADSCCPSLGYLIMRAETFDDEGIVCGGIKECDFFCKSLGFSCGKCQENPSACRCEETCY